jgi:hypothetical protein
VGLFDKLKQKKESRIPDTPTKRYEFTETGNKVLVDDDYKPKKKNLFTSENKARFVSGAKTTGRALQKGAKKFGEMQRAADAREAKRERSGKVVNDYGFGYSDMISGGRKSRRPGPTASDITDSILGTGGSKRRKSKRSNDIFDFDF